MRNIIMVAPYTACRKPWQNIYRVTTFSLRVLIEVRLGEGNGQGAEGDVKAMLGEMPDCPHDRLLESGYFPAWMQYCPLCGEEMKKKLEKS